MRARVGSRAREEAQRTKETAKAELGHALVELVEEYFPEQANAERSRREWGLFVGGLLLGFYLARRFDRTGP